MDWTRKCDGWTDGQTEPISISPFFLRKGGGQLSDGWDRVMFEHRGMIYITVEEDNKVPDSTLQSKVYVN
jgi:hypothetical protein